MGKGVDVDYYLDQVAAGANYYLDAGEPAGQWWGRGAEALGLTGEVDPDVMRALYHHHVGPDGVPLGKPQKDPRYQGRKMWEVVEARIQKRIDDLGPVLATPEKKREIRLSERAQARSAVPFYDMTASSEKSVSLAWAAARIIAAEARRRVAEQDEAGGEANPEQDEAGWGDPAGDVVMWEAIAKQTEAATVAASDAMLRYVQDRGGAIVRTGHHSVIKDGDKRITTGEWRDASGFVTATFLQHTSRLDDPQLHVQAVILNRAQREDGADDIWRCLDGQQLYALRLGASAHASMAHAQHLARMGLPLVKRPDGNGYEIGGVRQETMDAFSRRAKSIEKKVSAAIDEYEAMYGRPPSRAALYRLRKQVTVSSRKAKSKPKQQPAPGAPVPSKAEADAAEERLEEWVRHAQDEHTQALRELWDDIWDYLAEHPEANPSEMPSEAERHEIVRAAVAEVQRQNSTWTRGQIEFEIARQMPVLPASADWERELDDLTEMALANRVEDSIVLQVGHVPDVVDVAPLGLRKDGTSILRVPNEARWTTPSHLDREEWVLRHAVDPVAQAVDDAAVEEALAGTDLDYDQRAAAKGLLTSTDLVSSLVAPAGSGKTHVMSAVSRAWVEHTGSRMIGLTLSQNAANVMAGEGMTEAHNISRFFARGVPVYRNDVLVVDEASQVSTNDLARIMQLARDNGARVILSGDPQQLGPVEAGGMFRVIADEHGSYELTEVRRFDEAWQAKASIRMRDGDLKAWGEYRARGLVKDGPENRMQDMAVDSWILDTNAGKSVLLMCGTNEQAAELSGLVRARRAERGEVGEAQLELSDGNDCGVGDLVRARLNSRIKAGGRVLTNRDTIRIEGFLDLSDGTREAVAVRRDGDLPGGWSTPFTVPSSYLAEHAELDYGANIFVGQGRTVDSGYLVGGPGLDRHALYVAMTRGRSTNRAYVVTGPADPHDWTREQRDAWREAAVAEAIELQKQGNLQAAMTLLGEGMPEPEGMMDRAPWESVIGEAMSREAQPPTAIETIRQAHDLTTNMRHLHDIAQAFWWKDVVPQIDEMVRERIPAREFDRYMADPERPALLQELRAREIGGQAIPDVLDAITGRDFGGAQSIAAVLHGRAGKLEAPARGQTTTWTERNPNQASPEVQETYRAMADAQAELGEALAQRPPRWALGAWGVPPAEEGALREDWKERASQVESYRQMAGITDPRQAVGPAPARQAELTEAYAASVRALALPDEAALYRAMGRGDLEAEVRAYERAQAAAPADVTADLEHNRDALAYAQAQAEEAAKNGNETIRQSAEALRAELEAERARLQVQDAARAEWAEAAAPQAEAAERAEAELRRRPGTRRQAERQAEGQTQPQQSPEPEAELQHVDPGTYAERRAQQTAQVQADREARRMAGARSLAELSPDMAREAYPDLADRALAELQAEREAEMSPFERAAEAARHAREVLEARRKDELERQAEHERIQDRDLSRRAEAQREARRPGRVQRPPAPVRQNDGPSIGL